MKYLTRKPSLLLLAVGAQIRKYDSFQYTRFRRTSSSVPGDSDTNCRNHILTPHLAINWNHASRSEEPSLKPDGWISLTEFKNRRHWLAEKIAKYPIKSPSTNEHNFIHNKHNFDQLNQSSKLKQDNTYSHHHLVIIPASERQYMVGKIPHFFRQSTDFRYLTGHVAPEAALILVIETTGKPENLTVR